VTNCRAAAAGVAHGAIQSRKPSRNKNEDKTTDGGPDERSGCDCAKGALRVSFKRFIRSLFSGVKRRTNVGRLVKRQKYFRTEILKRKKSRPRLRRTRQMSGQYIANTPIVCGTRTYTVHPWRRPKRRLTIIKIVSKWFFEHPTPGLKVVIIRVYRRWRRRHSSAGGREKITKYIKPFRDSCHYYYF